MARPQGRRRARGAARENAVSRRTAPFPKTLRWTFGARVQNQVPSQKQWMAGNDGRRSSQWVEHATRVPFAATRRKHRWAHPLSEEARLSSLASFPSSSLGTRLSAKLRFVRQLLKITAPRFNERGGAEVAGRCHGHPPGSLRLAMSLRSIPGQVRYQAGAW
jgi:hypothetical protein